MTKTQPVKKYFTINLHHTFDMNRIASIDILRGLAICGMILCANIGWNSDLPAWMFHAQVPPPDYIFRPDIPGITWVDLVFPFFLFSMGAAFPFALEKRIASGQPMHRIILGLVKRWAILAAFSIVLGNGYAARDAEANRFVIYLFQILAWMAMFLSLTRFSFRKAGLSGLLNLSGVILIGALAVFQEYVLGVPLSKSHSDIIIMILAYVALFGGLIWLVSRNSPSLRWLILIAISAVKALTAYAPQIFGFMPETGNTWIGWIFDWAFLQYLVIALAGSIAGDMILSAKKKAAANTATGSGTAGLWMAILALFTVVFQLWGLFTRHVAADMAVTVVSATVFILMTFRKRELWSDITAVGYLLLITGIIFDPIDGGITKDHCNLSYLFTTSGMAAMTTGFLICLESRHGIKSAILSECGQNPMIAYTVTNFLTAPILSAAGILQLIDSRAAGSPFMGIVRGVVITGIMMAVTIFFTRKKIFWRS